MIGKQACVLLAMLACSNCHLYATGQVDTVGGMETIDPECERLDTNFVGWSTVAVVSGSVATASTAAIGVVEGWDGPHADDAVLGLGITGGTASALAIAAGVVAGYYAERFGERCGP